MNCKKHLGYFLVSWLAGITFVTPPAQAALTIHITQGVEGAQPIALVPFSFQGGVKPAVNISDVIAQDLTISGRFSPLPVSELIERPDDSSKIDYSLWRNKRIDYLVVGKIQTIDPQTVGVQFELVDILKGNRLVGRQFQTRPTELRRVAHMISDQVYEAITGQRGAFDTYLAYVTITRDQHNKRIHRLAIADMDGANEQVIYESLWPIISPAWSPDATRVAFVVINNGQAELYVQNIYTKYTQKIAAFPGLNNAPAWSPDGRRMALTLSKDGNAEIYIMDIDTKKLTRITNNYSVDTEAAWLPDGSGLLFTSDRGGHPQIYRVNINDRGATGPAQRLTFDGDYNARASVSPDGKRIAMVHLVGGQFHISVLDLEHDQLTVLTDTDLDESPSFAPNGGMIVYETKDQGHNVLVITPTDGRVKYPLNLQSGDVRQPAWSPFKRSE
ncbi:MAG: Tol-Pal system beta propeller repeat protein TolB [Gammaproteobacteria bacterium]|nr:Tol-Pal system beta propeller repeat protein TolB [Gammaproteobacteria bacterium]